MNNGDTPLLNILFNPLDYISGNFGILSIINDIFLQFGWPNIFIIFTS